MSSTNRGADRHAADYYITPQWAIKAFLDALVADIADNDHSLSALQVDARLGSFAANILDPCAGGDENNDMAYPLALSNHAAFDNAIVTTHDWRMDARADIRGSDFLTWEPPHLFDMAITNPPFVIAQEITTKALEVVRPGGLVVMLLRLNFFGGAKRLSWWQANMAAACYVHSKRISFTPDGKTDSIEYMHCCWIKGKNQMHTALRVI